MKRSRLAGVNSKVPITDANFCYENDNRLSISVSTHHYILRVLFYGLCALSLVRM